MKQIAKFLVGSRVFFSGIKGFQSKDYDWLYIMDSFGSIKNKHLRFTKDGDDKILMPKMTKQEYINDTLESDFAMRVGKMFVPEFAAYIGLTVKDLAAFESALAGLDDKHKYYQIIYNAYKENGSFTLTNEQRAAAFEEYKKYRQ